MNFADMLVKRLLVGLPLAFVFGFFKALNGWPEWTIVAGGIAVGLVTHFAIPYPEQKEKSDGQAPTRSRID